MVVTATGWTYEELGRTPWPRIKDLLVHWQEYPPAHMSLRVGLLAKKDEDDEDEDDGVKVGFTEAQLRMMAGGR